jgi:hypothetical protein
MPAWALKAGAAVLTMLFALASAHYVAAHERNQAAPLHPSVRTTDVQPVTTTYAS